MFISDGYFMKFESFITFMGVLISDVTAAIFYKKYLISILNLLLRKYSLRYLKRIYFVLLYIPNIDDHTPVIVFYICIRPKISWWTRNIEHKCVNFFMHVTIKKNECLFL